MKVPDTPASMTLDAKIRLGLLLASLALPALAAVAAAHGIVISPLGDGTGPGPYS